jgi:ABC-type nickel/cobalt efflux system permease component RcnA
VPPLSWFCASSWNVRWHQTTGIWPVSNVNVCIYFSTLACASLGALRVYVFKALVRNCERLEYRLALSRPKELDGSFWQTHTHTHTHTHTYTHTHTHTHTHTYIHTHTHTYTRTHTHWWCSSYYSGTNQRKTTWGRRRKKFFKTRLHF